MHWKKKVCQGKSKFKVIITLIISGTTTYWESRPATDCWVHIHWRQRGMTSGQFRGDIWSVHWVSCSFGLSTKFKTQVIAFSISGELSKLIGCLKIRTSYYKICFEEPLWTFALKETQQMEEWFKDSSLQCTIFEEIFGVKQHYSDGKSGILTGPAPCKFSLPENQVCAQRKQVWVCGCSENKSNVALQQHNTRWPAALETPNGVEILKGITLQLSDFVVSSIKG